MLQNQSEIDLAEQTEQAAEQTPLDRESRTRTLTERGREHKINFYKNNFKTALSVWQRTSNKITVLLSDCQDADILKMHRNNLEIALEEYHMKFYPLEGLKENISAEANRLDQIEGEHQHLMHSISEYIRDLDNQKYKTREIASCRSARSRASHASSVRSDISKMSDAAVKKATLKAELKYIDVESKIKAELQKIKL